MEIDEADAFSSSSEDEYSFTRPVIEAIESWQETNSVLIGGWQWRTEAEYLIRQEEMVECVARSVNGVDSN